MEPKRLNRHGIPIFDPANVEYPTPRNRAPGNVKLGSCCWPGCANTVRPSDHFHPLCVVHAFKIYELGCALNDFGGTGRDTWIAMQTEKYNLAAAERRQAVKTAAIRGVQPGWVYYVLIDGLIKIGYATDVKKRLRSYPPSQVLLAVHPGTKKLERDMHHQFKAYLERGREWFQDCPEIRAHCAEAVEVFGSPARFAYHYRGARPVQGIGQAS